MLTLGAFIVAIAFLVAFHEWGHFAMARACGVKVLCFSLGFGPKLLSWTSSATGTEYRLAALPLGGFVRMLDEREAPVPENLLAQAFNTQALFKRALIVAAGPLANLLLAVALYSLVNWMGFDAPAPRIAKPAAETIAAQAGLLGGETVLRVTADGEAPEDIVTFEDLRWTLSRVALRAGQVRLAFKKPADDAVRETLLNFTDLPKGLPAGQILPLIGIELPYSEAVIAEVKASSPAAQGGLQTGDSVRAIDGLPVADAGDLRARIRASGTAHEPKPQNWQIVRQGQAMALQLSPRRETENGQFVGRIGAMIGMPPLMLKVQYGLLEGVHQGLVKTGETAHLTLRMLGQIVTGSASLKNLSGPLTIAEYAGRSASIGLTPFLVFLALVSISLGVINLLPVPVLDGGHLMYYLWEAVTGRSVSDAWMAKLQRVGVALLLCMMSVATFNDVSRLLF